MSMVSKVFRLYEWKERLAHHPIPPQYEEAFTTFDWWFDSISFDRVEPEESDIIFFTETFREIERCFGGFSSA